MEFDALAAIGAGLIGGGVMVALLYLGIVMMPGQMRMNLLKLLGTMILPAGAAAYMLGFMMHAMMSVVFGLLHAAFFNWLGVEAGALWLPAHVPLADKPGLVAVFLQFLRKGGRAIRQEG